MATTEEQDRPADASEPTAEAPSRSRAQRVLFPLAALGLAALLVLFGAEGLLRVQERLLPRVERDTTGAAPLAEGNPTPLPLRGPRYTFEPGQFRIVTLGDSFTWGDGIWAHEDVWPNRIETLLAERTTQSVGVVNLAVRGFTAVASANALRDFGIGLKPDLIMYGFYINDALLNLPDGRCLLWDYQLYANLFRDPLHDWWDAHSALYRRANSGWMAYQVRTDPVGWNRHYTEGTEEWAQFKDGLRHMAELAWATRTPVVVVLWPDWGVGSIAPGEYKWETLYATVASAATQYDLRVLDLTPAFAATDRPPKEWCLTRNDCHPSVEAHHLAANLIVEFLQEQGLGPGPPPPATADGS